MPHLLNNSTNEDQIDRDCTLLAIEVFFRCEDLATQVSPSGYLGEAYCLGDVMRREISLLHAWRFPQVEARASALLGTSL